MEERLEDLADITDLLTSGTVDIDEDELMAELNDMRRGAHGRRNARGADQDAKRVPDRKVAVAFNSISTNQSKTWGWRHGSRRRRRTLVSSDEGSYSLRSARASLKLGTEVGDFSFR